ncbi:MAG TPA: histidinol-phosphate transaminase [Solirubrobacteraceae bacterium]|nr:histidinol-phosphate transaminase [Solirubrobacteraceae bacterium]
MALEFSQVVKRIPAYPAGVGYAHTGPLVRLESNESPYPPLPAIIAAATTALESANRYPDPESTALRAALSERYGIPTAQITVGNGSCDVLLAAGQALLEPGTELVHAWPSFSVYPQLEAASGARAIRVALDAEERHDLAAMADAITERTRLVIVCNPNNPTSTALELARIAEFVDAVPRQVCVMIDEAYCEFNTLDPPDASLALLAEHENLVLLRTFSKVYGLCGLRVGFALCGSSELPSALKLIRQPFFCNAVAQAAASEALLHPEEVIRRVEASGAARGEMRERLRSLGLSPADSEANFCWFDLPPLHGEADIVRGLAEQGILVRAGSALGKAGALRVTFGTREENARFIEVLGSLL